MLPQVSSRLVTSARWVAWCMTLAGISLVVVGVLRATVWDPGPDIAATSRANTAGPVVEAVPGMLALMAPRVEVEAEGTSKVFLGIGRAADVDAYLANVSRTQLVGLRGEATLVTRARKGEASLPDPAEADLWVAKATGTGSARLSWADRPGRWRLVASTDGKAPAPSRLTLRWTDVRRATGAPALISLGVVGLVAGVVILALLWVRAREEEELL